MGQMTNTGTATLPTAEPVSAQCLHAGVLDEVLISVTPLLLGEDPRQRAARASA